MTLLHIKNVGFALCERTRPGLPVDFFLVTLPSLQFAASNATFALPSFLPVRFGTTHCLGVWKVRSAPALVPSGLEAMSR